MRYFERKPIMVIIFLFSAAMILFSGVLQITMNNNYGMAIFQILVALLFAYDAYVYKRPYLGLDEEKLIINNGLVKKEIFLKDVITIDDRNKKLTITYSQGSSKMKLRILLSQLKKYDKEEFIKDLKSKQGSKVYVD